MRFHLFLAIVCGLSITVTGCGGSGASSSASSNAKSAPPPPPGASAAPGAPGGAGGTTGQPSGADSAATTGNGPPGAGSSSPDGASGYPAGPPGYGPPGASGPGGSSASGYPPSGYPPTTPPTGYPGAGLAGSPDSAGGYPGASGGYPGSADGTGLLAAPPRPKTLREKAVDAFRQGRSDDGVLLLSAHYLTTPTAGPELGRVMQYSPKLNKPSLLSRIGIAVVYSSQPANFEGHPQPIGSPELEASLAPADRNTDGGGGGEGGNRRVGGLRRGGRGGEGNAQGASGPPGSAVGGYGSGLGGGGENNLPTSPREELAYFTGELGTKLEEKLRSKLESGAFGVIYREALKDIPLAAPVQGEAGEGLLPEGGVPGRSGPPGPGGISGPSGYGPRPPGVAQPGGNVGPGSGNEAKDSGIHTGQIIPGVEFLGAVENVKELGELAKSSSVDAIVTFVVRVRPATAIALVNNDTTIRVVTATDVNKHLYQSPTLNNKQVHETRKKRGAEDPVAKEIDATVAALEANFKLVPLPALTPEQAMSRLTFLLGKNPEDATSLLLEARLFVAKKLLKPEDVVTLALTQVTEEQLGALSEVLEGENVKEKIGAAITGKRADAPTTVLGKFGAALSGAGGLGGLVPTPRMPGVGVPGAMPPGGFPQPGTGPGGYGPGGYSPSGAPPGASSPPGPAPPGPLAPPGQRSGP